MITHPFTSGEYHTNENTIRPLMDKLLFNSRWYFLSKYIGIIMKSRKLALKEQFDRQAWVNSSIEILRLIEACGGRFHLSGLNNLKHCKGPVVFVSNHMSTLETMVFPGIIAPFMKVTFVVKDSLVKHPLFGPVMRARYPIVVNRSNSREDFRTVIDRGRDLIADGISVIIFPQSTRTVDFIPAEFNSLGVKLASKNEVQVIPVAIKTDFWENGKYLKEIGPLNRSKPIHMAFGKAIEVSGSGKKENQYIIDFISDHLKKWEGTITN